MADPALAKPEPPTVTVAVDEAQLQKLLDQFAAKKQSSWQYWKEKLILPVSLTLAGTLITLIVGLIQSKQAQDNFNNSLEITRIQSREKYLTYFTDKDKKRIDRLPALASLIDLGAPDLAADLLVLNLGENDKDDDDQSQVTQFVLTTGTKLLPRLCYLTSYSNYAYETLFRNPTEPVAAPAKLAAADIALDYALSLADHPHERAYIESTAFLALSPNESTSDQQLRDGALIVMAVLAGRIAHEDRDKEKQTKANNELTSKFVALLGTDRSTQAKAAAIAGLLNLGRTREMLALMTDAGKDDSVRNYARAGLSQAQRQPRSVSDPASKIFQDVDAAALKIFQNVDESADLRCALAISQPNAYKSGMARLLVSDDVRQRRFAVECFSDGFSGIDRATVLAHFQQEPNAEIRAIILQEIWPHWSEDEKRVILAALKDPEARVRSLAYIVVAHAGSREADQLLIAGLKDPDPSVVRDLVYQVAIRKPALQRKAFRLQIDKLPDSDQKTELLDIMDRQSGRP